MGSTVRLQLTVRRFVCALPACWRRTFSEPLPEVVAPSARRSVRLAAEQQRLGLQVGGAVAARIAQRQGVPISPATVLRLGRRTPLAEHATPSLLGVDEWTYRKRLDFKTILVDLSTRRPIELLPDTDAATFATWLNTHPGVAVIARDRAGAFAEGATHGAPDALHVADRFHLIQHLRAAIEQILNRMVEARQAAAVMVGEQAAQMAASSTAPCEGPEANAAVLKRDMQRVHDAYRQKVQDERRARRLARYERGSCSISKGCCSRNLPRTWG